MTEQDNVVYKFIRIPIPVGTAGLLIWAAFSFIQKWDPRTYQDFQTIFWLPLMQVYMLVVVLGLVAYYVYTGVNWLRIEVLRVRIGIAERRHPPPDGMVLVPKGPFRFRLEKEKKDLEDFFIDKYPVTNEDYMTFIRESGHPAPSSWNNLAFSWDNVPGKDGQRLLRYLRDGFCIGWTENAEIHKSDDGKTIRIFKDENSAGIMINKTEQKATLKISDGRTHNLKVVSTKIVQYPVFQE